MRRRILIVCEGTKTEPTYFRSIINQHRLNGAVEDGRRLQWDVEGAARSTLTLVERAASMQRPGADRYDEIWCVFDKDSFKDEDFDNAIKKTEDHRFLRSAWSNEAFELWYVLHFQYLDTAPAGAGGTARSYYQHRLTELLREHYGRDRYAKNDPEMYVLLGSERLQGAMRNARKLLACWHDGVPCHKRKPATTVHVLVEAMLRYAREAEPQEQ
jgi:hypothetical protein